jgi:hypothetical protein
VLQILHAVHHEFYVQYCAVLSGVIAAVFQHGMPALQVAVMKKGLTGKRIKDIRRLGTGLSSA